MVDKWLSIYDVTWRNDELLNYVFVIARSLWSSLLGFSSWGRIVTVTVVSRSRRSNILISIIIFETKLHELPALSSTVAIQEQLNWMVRWIMQAFSGCNTQWVTRTTETQWYEEARRRNTRKTTHVTVRLGLDQWKKAKDKVESTVWRWEIFTFVIFFDQWGVEIHLFVVNFLWGIRFPEMRNINVRKHVKL